jgi:NAD(P)-dependent dehydrogenase (short-subunit alcohol dehydrogenase family)
MKRYQRKTAIVTGATMGIGEAVVRRLVDEGANVVLVARGVERGEALASELGPGRAVFVAGSVAESAIAERAVEAAGRLGGVDVLVNNAAINHTRPLLETAESEVRELFDINLFGSWWMLVQAARDMRSRGGGSIINITSRLAVIGVPTMSAYGASKGGLLALTRGAAIEFAEDNVRVNAVAPGLTATPLHKTWIAAQPDPEAFERDVASTIPQKRFATPEDVAAAVAYLGADEASHVTGATIPVDGGYTAA